jgi:branched-chain amino acid transport system ATP-binding protein
VNWDIVVQDVHKYYGGVKAVDGVNFIVPGGTLAGLMGPNGAGKSTLFNVITRVVDPTSGAVRLGEEHVTGMPISSFAKLPVGRTFQTPRCFLSLSVLDNVTCMLRDPRDTFVGALFRRSPPDVRAQASELLERVGLFSRRAESAASLSGGERRMLEIARQLARRPRVLLLDEPTAGLDGVHQATLRELLVSLAAEGVTILIVEHNVGFLMSTATTIYVMALGNLIMHGSPSDVAASPAVVEAYFGKGATSDVT